VRFSSPAKKSVFSYLLCSIQCIRANHLPLTLLPQLFVFLYSTRIHAPSAESVSLVQPPMHALYNPFIPCVAAANEPSNWVIQALSPLNGNLWKNKFRNFTLFTLLVFFQTKFCSLTVVYALNWCFQVVKLKGGRNFSMTPVAQN
jgi:hypothetical protein